MKSIERQNRDSRRQHADDGNDEFNQIQRHTPHRHTLMGMNAIEDFCRFGNGGSELSKHPQANWYSTCSAILQQNHCTAWQHMLGRVFFAVDLL